MVGWPVAALLGGGPSMILATPTDSILPSSVHTAPAASQSAAGNRDTVTMAPDSGVNRTSHRSLRSSTRLTATAALVTSRAWSRSASGVVVHRLAERKPEGERHPRAGVGPLRHSLEPRRQRLACDRELDAERSQLTAAAVLLGVRRRRQGVAARGQRGAVLMAAAVAVQRIRLVIVRPRDPVVRPRTRELKPHALQLRPWGHIRPEAVELRGIDARQRRPVLDRARIQVRRCVHQLESGQRVANVAGSADV